MYSQKIPRWCTQQDLDSISHFPSSPSGISSFVNIHCIYLIGANHAARQHHVHCFGFTYGPNQALRAAAAGNHPKLDFWLAKFRAVAADLKRWW